MRGLGVILLGALVVACGPPAPPTPTPSSDLPSLPLPANVSGIPAPGAPTAVLEPHTPAGSVPVSEEQSYQLGHCGLISPIDLDGSLWDPIAGDDGLGGPLTQDQLGDLINGTPVALVLVDHETMLMATQHGGRVVLTRHDGLRAYNLCA